VELRGRVVSREHHLCVSCVAPLWTHSRRVRWWDVVRCWRAVAVHVSIRCRASEHACHVRSHLAHTSAGVPSLTSESLLKLSSVAEQLGSLVKVLSTSRDRDQFYKFVQYAAKLGAYALTKQVCLPADAPDRSCTPTVIGQFCLTGGVARRCQKTGEARCGTGQRSQSLADAQHLRRGPQTAHVEDARPSCNLASLCDGNSVHI
jgi:hypothetical protein